jgi:hypothetical protein
MSQVSEGAGAGSAAAATSASVGEGSILGQGGDTGDSAAKTLLGDAGKTAESAADSTKKPAADAGAQADKEGQPAPVTGLAPLPENATEEQKRDFAQKLRALNGVPDNADGYGDFGFGDAVKIDTASEDYKYYTKLFHDVGLSAGQAKKLLEAHKQYAEGQVAHAQKQQDSVVSDYRAQVKRDFVKSLGGDAQFKEFQDTAIRGFKAAAKGAGMSDKEAAGLLNIMGDDPRFVKMFNGIGKLFREDVLITGAAPAAKESSFDDMFSNMFKQ